jgi:BirA family biotin operon repressor/biotin-[acetyl-CoA-carboxylase] ligase
MSDRPARVLEALRVAGDAWLSGEALSGQLGVSRAQVWKHVQALRRRGYEIAGEAGGGYHLVAVPDRLFADEVLRGLETRWIAQDFHYLESTDSTNRVAFELAAQGAPHGSVVVAEGQTAGRGRLGRTFFSPPHRNLYTSVVLRPEVRLAEAPTLILAAAVAVAEAVGATVEDPEAASIKWPNDVQLGGRKTAGILMELHAEATRVGFLILGIGVNLNVRQHEFPEELREVATSLAIFSGHGVDRAAFARRLYGTLEEVMDLFADAGFEGLRSRFESHFHMPGRHVEVSEADGSSKLSGVALGIDADGSLRVRTEDGRETRVVAGDVTLTGSGGVA